MSIAKFTTSLATARLSGTAGFGARHLATATQRCASEKSDQPSEDDAKVAAKAQEIAEKAVPKHKTVAEADAELMAKLAGHADAGGAAGIEYEDGKPVAQKRSVRNNMFRLI